MDIVERLRFWGTYGVSKKDLVKYSNEAADEIERLREVSQQQLDAAYANGYDAAYAMGYSEGLKETLYDGMPRRVGKIKKLKGKE